MANLIRSPKSGSKWTTNELLAFNIKVHRVDAAAFFGATQLPAASVSEFILNNKELPTPSPPGLTKDDTKFYQYLAMASSSAEESAVDDFASHVLKMLDYDSGDRIIRTRKEMGFYMGGEHVDAKADVTVMSGDYCLLVVQENKRLGSPDDPEPQLIAESIAAFAQNRRLRESAAGFPSLSRQAVPGITMVGTSPVFYRTIVTESLLNALSTLTYPSETTTVLKFVPPVPSPLFYLRDGMVPLDNRSVVFACFEAFKQVIGEGLYNL